MIRGFLPLGLALLAGCTAGRTEIVLRVATDIPQGPGATISSIRVTIYSQGETAPHYTHTFALGDTPADPLLPDDLRIAPRGGDASRRITVDVEGLGADGSTRVTRRAVAGFSAGSTRLLSVFLAARCLAAANAACADGTTCGASGCEPTDQGNDLPAYTPPGDAATPEASTCTPASAPDYCNGAVPPLGADPVLDGVLECGLAARAVPLPTLAVGAGVRAEYAVAWRPTGLYVFARVYEPALAPVPASTPPTLFYCADAVEIFVDPSGQGGAVAWNPSTIQLIVTAPAPGASPSTRGGLEQAQPTTMSNTVRAYGQHLGAFAMPDGYVVEAFVTADEIGRAWNPSSTAQLGFDLQFDVSGGTMRPECPTGATLLGQFALRAAPETAGCTGDCIDPSLNGEAFCRPAVTPGS